jgi:GST-like protein
LLAPAFTGIFAWPAALRLDGDNTWQQLPNVKRLFDAIDARPAAQRVQALKDRHAFKTDMDEVAQRAMFPRNERLKRPTA